VPHRPADDIDRLVARAPRASAPRHRARSLTFRLLSFVGVLALIAGPLALSGVAAGPLTMDARMLLQGHARAGGWAAIQVDLKNDGPPVTGELRVAGGSQNNARYAVSVSLPTGSHQVYVLHIQPPLFGHSVKVDLVQDERVVTSATVAYIVHDANQLIVGVLAERPAAIVSQIHLPAGATGAAAVIVPLTVADLPERAEGWSVIDRLVWQDVDSNQLTPAQLDALRRWIAAGGRLVIVGGSAGIGTLSAFPDALLPYRPTATLDLDPVELVSLTGPLPDAAATLPAMGGALSHGRALASSGDRTVAAEMAYGSGRVTLLGFDPTTKWLAESKAIDALWRTVLPDRIGDPGLLIDDSQLVQAVYQLPALQLPPTSGLLVIIVAYILIIGPINYLVLKRLDRRELAWVTMPILVITFAVAAFGYGSFLRGTDVVVNEVAIVHGAPDATEASAQVYFGIFSPSRATYQVDVPQGALLAAPINGDPFGQGVSTTLDILQGTGTEQPSAVRNLSVSSGSLRVVRAQLPVEAPRMKASLTMVKGVLTGTFENASEVPLEGVAVVLGSAVQVLGNVAPHATMNVNLPIRDNPFGSSLADQVVGQSFDTSSEAGVRRATRYSMVNQLGFDPTGQFAGSLPADQAVILAFGNTEILQLKVGDQEPRRNANVLYYVPVAIGIKGPVTFGSDLLRTSVIDSSAQVFSKDRFFLSMGAGNATLAYRPIPFDGQFTVSEIRFALSPDPSQSLVGGGKVVTPLTDVPPVCTDATNSVPAGCEATRADGLPEVEVFDRTGGGAWLRLPRLNLGASYTLANPTRFVDPATGQILVRFVNDNAQSGAGFGFQLALVGDVE
jgi:hypothetical protein